MQHEVGINRRTMLRGGAALALAGGATALGGGAAHAVRNGHGLTVVDSNESAARLRYYRFRTDAIAWNPAINVILPDGYHTSGKRYPVMYFLHGGQQDFRAYDQWLVSASAHKDVIIVVPDGGAAGWYSNPVSSNNGAHNWETFHIAQVIPWIDANFRTHAEYDGRAVSGFSMGGFGALKYAAKYYGHFASVSSHSGPASIRRDNGLVAHWANLSSAVVELAGGTIYGAPLWDERRVSADNPVERIPSYRNKRIFLAAGTQPDPINLLDVANETQVLAGQREFRAALHNAGITFESHERNRGHLVEYDLLRQDIDGVIRRLRRA